MKRKVLVYGVIMATVVSSICMHDSKTIQAMGIDVPGENAEMTSIGADMPYTRYDSKEAIIGAGAVLETSDDFDKNNIASQASEQSYVRLPMDGSYAEWTMSTTGDGVTMRFTMPDSEDGMGLKGSLDVYVNGKKVQTVDLDSYYMWQYFEKPDWRTNPTGSPSDKPVEGATPSFAFDEVHFKLKNSLKPGDRIRIQSTKASGLEYGVDFLEIEDVPEPIKKPDNAYSVTDFGAKPNDKVSDMNTINKCIQKAQEDGKDVYIPAGTYIMDSIWRLNASNVKITGAGIWYTNIKFNNSGKGRGGISGSKASNVEFCNMYLNSSLRSRYVQQATYKCFMDVWSDGCYIHDIWEEHFECGFWLADYNFSDGTDYSDGIKIANSRIRNNLADGVNFCQGTSNATVYNCSIRNNGDDGLAMWNNNWQVKDEENNTFCYNTIDFIWRAGAIAIYGGNGHKVYNNYITDSFMASGIHINTAFDGYKFNNNNNGITISNNIMVRSGTSSDSWNSEMAAVDITEPNGKVKNITFNNTYIYDAQHDGVRITGNPENVVFNNLKIIGAGKDKKTKSVDNKGSALRFDNKNTSKDLTINGFEYGNIPYSGIIYGKRDNIKISGEKNLGNNVNVEIPLAKLKKAPQSEPEKTSDKIKITGLQISEISKGVRALYSVENEIDGKKVVEAGNIYGIVKNGFSDNDLSAYTKYSLVTMAAATEKGILNYNLSGSDTATNYAMTMINNGYTKEAFSQKYKIRPYAKLEDGSYVYGEICEYSIEKIKDVLDAGAK